MMFQLCDMATFPFKIFMKNVFYVGRITFNTQDNDQNQKSIFDYIVPEYLLVFHFQEEIR